MKESEDVDLLTRLWWIFIAVIVTVPLADYVAHWWAKFLGWE